MTNAFRSAIGRWQQVRIRSPWAKLGVVVAWWVVGFALATVLRWLGVGDLAIVLIGAVYDIGVIAAATRVFRGAYERSEPSRPWWRATGRPTAGFVLAAALLLVSVWALLRFPADAASIVLAVEWIVVAIFYFQSSVRLARGRGGTETQRQPKRSTLEKSLAKPMKFPT